MKTILFSAFILVFFVLSCDNSKLEKETNIDTIDNIFFQRSQNKDLSIQERFIAIDSFLIESKTSADTLNILKGLYQKTFLLGKDKQHEKAIYFCEELLEIAIANRNDRYRIKGYDRIARYYNKLEEYDKSIHYSKKLIKLSKNINDSISESKGYFTLGISKNQQNKLSESFKYFNEAFLIRRLKKDSVRAVAILLEMARVQKKTGSYRASQSTASDGLNFINEFSKTDNIVGLYFHISVTNRELNNYKEALEFNKKALEKETRESNIIKLKNTKANILADQGDYKKAINILDSLLSLSIIKNNDKELARVSSNLGHVKWLEDEDNDESEELLLSALQIREKNEDTSGLIATYTHLTKFYSKTDKKQALRYAQKIYENAKIFKSRVEIIKSIDWITKLKDELGEPISNKLILEQSRMYNYLEKARNDTERIYADTKFQNDELKETNYKLEIDAEKKQRQNTTYIAIVGVLIISSIFLYIILQSKHKREKAKEVIKETFQTERRLSKKVHDELANDMSSTLNFIDNHAAIPKDVKTYLVNKMEELYERSRDVSAEIGGFDNKNFAKSLKFLITQYNSDSVKVITNVTSGIYWDIIPDHKKINIYRSLQELLVNTKKHSKATAVTVIFKSEGKKHFINYTDNGEGFEIENVFIRGLQNVETRIKNIGGNITFNTSKGNGFKARLQF